MIHSCVDFPVQHQIEHVEKTMAGVFIQYSRMCSMHHSVSVVELDSEVEGGGHSAHAHMEYVNRYSLHREK